MDTTVRVIPAGASTRLRALIADLDNVASPIETTFVSLGNTLVQAHGLLETVATEFRTLASLFESEDGANALATLSQARQGTLGLASNAKTTSDRLAELEGASAALARLLDHLIRVNAEISALATNAKVQAAQINARDVDFSVFTKEIDRLHHQADSIARQASERLTALRASLGSACHTAKAFRDGNSRDLDEVGSHLQANLEELEGRHRTASDAAQRFTLRAEEIRNKTAQCISQLQVGDITRQRIEHVGQAFGILCSMIDHSATAKADDQSDWFLDLDEGRKAHLLGTVCRLQAKQYNRASAECISQTAALKRNLAALAEDADSITIEAQRIFGRAGTDDSAIHGVAVEVDRATQLLNSYRQSDALIRQQIVSVTAGFAAMAEDVAAIHSIDADMRIMGLNATLKCSRLGSAGMALGVVAHELRACSRRTEEVSHAIVAAIESSAAQASQLDQHSAKDHQATNDLSASMASSIAALGKLEQDMGRSLGNLTTTCHDSSLLLGKTASGIAIEQQLATLGSSLLAQLEGLSSLAGSGDTPDSVRADIERLLAGHYTMSSERMIHDLLNEGDEAQIADQSDSGNSVDFF